MLTGILETRNDQKVILLEPSTSGAPNAVDSRTLEC